MERGTPRWPDLFLVGAAHAGTSELRAALDRHPSIGFCAVEQPHFFSGIRPASRFSRQIPVVPDESSYRALFAEVPPGSLAAEASTSYLWSAEAPERIAAVNPDARIVILLRDPIERAWAHHLADAAAGAERRGFLRALRDESSRPGRWGHDQVYLGAGFYADGLERYLARFGRDRVWVGFHESMGRGAGRAAAEVVDWLGLDPIVAPVLDPAPDGPRGRWIDRLRGSVGHPVAQPELALPIRRLLGEVFAEDVSRVRDLLGVIPPWSVAPAG